MWKKMVERLIFKISPFRILQTHLDRVLDVLKFWKNKIMKQEIQVWQS
jgi:hypothetical protein